VTLANRHNNKKKMAQVVEYPEGPRLRLCVPCDGKTLCDKLKALMLRTTGWFFKQDMIDLAREKDSQGGRRGPVPP
jgi:hypothetical protein